MARKMREQEDALTRHTQAVLQQKEAAHPSRTITASEGIT
jgi:hypothetical protein